MSTLYLSWLNRNRRDVRLQKYKTLYGGQTENAEFFLMELLFLFLFPTVLLSQAKLLDDFEEMSGWKAIASEGTTMKLEQADGYKGKSLALHFGFQGSGYAIAQKEFKLDLPPKYKFTFFLRGELPINNFEFKLLDAHDNVFWIKKLNVEYPTEWTKQSIKKRHISFAWGPSGGREIKQVEKIEFVVSAGTGGGSGTIYIDDFFIESLTNDSTGSKPVVTASSSIIHLNPTFALDSDATTMWRSDGTSDNEWWMIDLQDMREIGGLVIDW
ncbi:MAG: discoidin domain-containing protein, partial [Ignavibacteriae bacterium]|nr:discoidin domain-containing protein [Ignavibacteriota bacterium]